MSTIVTTLDSTSILSTTESMLHYYYSISDSDKKSYIHSLYHFKKECSEVEQLAVRHIVKALQTKLPEHHRRVLHFLHAKNIFQLNDVQQQTLSLDDAKIIIHNWAESQEMRSYSDPQIDEIFQHTKAVYQEKLESLFVKSELCIVNNIAFKAYPNAVQMLDFWMKKGVNSELYYFNLEAIMQKSLSGFCRYILDLLQESEIVANSVKNSLHLQTLYLQTPYLQTRAQQDYRNLCHLVLSISDELKELLSQLFDAENVANQKIKNLNEKLEEIKNREQIQPSPFLRDLSTVVYIVGTNLLNLIVQIRKSALDYGLNVLKLKDDYLTPLFEQLSNMNQKIELYLSSLDETKEVSAFGISSDTSAFASNTYPTTPMSEYSSSSVSQSQAVLLAMSNKAVTINGSDNG